MAWANQQPDREGGKSREQSATRLFRAWAASELYQTTGDEMYNEQFKALFAAGAMNYEWSMTQAAPITQWPYATCTRPGADKTIQAELRKSILQRADVIVRDTDAGTYRMATKALSWGQANGGGLYGDACLRAYWLSGDQKYLDAASLNADFQLGANPPSQSLITGMGTRFPGQPQINPLLFADPRLKVGATVKGISIYGMGSGDLPGWYPDKVPAWRWLRDISGGAEQCSEFTITETIGAAAMLYSGLYALEPEVATKP